MTWESFYLVCFLLGLLLSALSLLGGMGHIGGNFHAPHVPHPHAFGHATHLPHAGMGGSVPQGPATVPWWNAFSLMVFLCWFGAAGYLLTRYGGFIAGVVVVLVFDGVVEEPVHPATMTPSMRAKTERRFMSGLLWVRRTSA